MLEKQSERSNLCGKLINITTLPLFCVQFSLLSVKYVRDSSVLLMEKSFSYVIYFELFLNNSKTSVVFICQCTD